jgi:hypothetical protein
MVFLIEMMTVNMNTVQGGMMVALKRSMKKKVTAQDVLIVLE